MTHSLKITLMLSLSLSASNAQNLVPNPSFEILDSCPDGTSQIDRATGWLPFTTSPDLFHTCANFPGNISAFTSQCPATGSAFAGIGCFMSFDRNEIFGIELMDSLIIGTKYYISFKVNLVNNAKCGIDKLGARFSTRKYCYSLNDTTNLCDSTPAPLNNFAHIFTTQIITDTINWTKISGSFVADSNYKYIMIGHLFDTSTTNFYLFPPNTSCGGVVYYLIDDICVSPDSFTCVDITRDIVDYSSDSSTIQLGSCINFSMNTVINYDLYQWQFKGAMPNISTDSMPTNICYDSTGSFDVILVASDSNGCSDTVLKSNYITVTNPSSVEKLREGFHKHLLVFPNPATEHVNISFFSHYEEIISINIYDTMGKLVMNKNNFERVPEIINISELIPGFYIFEIILDNTIHKAKLLKTL